METLDPHMHRALYNNSTFPGVCVFSALYHRTLGGLGRQAVLFTEYLASSGVPVFVIARKMKGIPPCHYDPAVKVFWTSALRPSVHILEEKSILNLLTSITFSLGSLYALWRKRRDYQIAHFHGASIPLMICILFLKAMRKKIIAKVAAANLGTEAGSLKGRYGPMGWILRRLMLKVDLFIAISREIEEGLKKDGVDWDRIRRIPNFVDLQAFHPASEEAKIKAKANKNLLNYQVVTFSGRLVPRKGLSVLLDAWPSIYKAFPSACLIILGEGPQQAEYERLAASRRLSGSVSFLGRVEDVVGYLHATDIYVLPSFQEGFPNALLEAMACGLPVVASRIGGVEDVIKPDVNGLLAIPGNADELSRAVIRLLQNPEEAQRLGREAARTIQEDYSIEKVAQRYLEVYRELGRSPSNYAS